MWCIMVFLKAADERESSQSQSSHSQQGNSDFKEKVTQLVHCHDSLQANSAHVAPGKLTHSTM